MIGRTDNTAKVEVSARRVVALAALLVLVLATAARGQTVVQLRAAARVDASGPVTLGRLAMIEGVDAQTLASVVVIESVERELGAGAAHFDLDSDRIRSAIERDGRVGLGNVVVRSGRCAVVPRAARGDEGVGSPEPKEPDLDELLTDTTVGGVIRREIRRMFKVEERDLRVSFDPLDRELLTMSAIGRAVVVRRTGSSGRLPLAVTVYEDERIVAGATIRADVKLKRTVLVAAVPIERGATIEAAQLTEQTQWLDPGVAPALQAAGAEARSPIPAGRIVTDRMIQAPVAIERGELAIVHCLAGSIVIEEKARALGTARVGEVIEFESVDGLRRRFTARVDAPGRAVLTTTGEAR
ncbi:MAG: flagellar basal body P-ring formation chaperone FlgA [Phycisphaerales bacterium JB037]